MGCLVTLVCSIHSAIRSHKLRRQRSNPLETWTETKTDRRMWRDKGRELVSLGKCFCLQLIELIEKSGYNMKDLRKEGWRNMNMKKFQNGGGGNLKTFFYVSRMRDKHRENRQMRKTARAVCCEQPYRRCLYSALYSRNYFKAFTPQIFTDVSQFANYCGVSNFGWIYLYDYETTIARCKWFISLFSYGSGVVVHKLCLNAFWLLLSAHLLLLT